ncbi:hypothetical protein NDU88_005601 [Pleurodeles waltl]|uniref:Uncharacterized protein n=1 Tax=Pleurodeles waltl TaxID=8319 RepID=A0AAV7QIL7_PLEWA|nr:hypothetical protein NDU88_005601 [Pleurodeles waltl]
MADGMEGENEELGERGVESAEVGRVTGDEEHDDIKLRRPESRIKEKRLSRWFTQVFVRRFVPWHHKLLGSWGDKRTVEK